MGTAKRLLANPTFITVPFITSTCCNLGYVQATSPSCPFPRLWSIPPPFCAAEQECSCAHSPRVLCERLCWCNHSASHMASASPAASGGVPPDGSVLDLVLAGVLGNKLGALVLAPTVAVFLWFLVSYQTSPLKKYPGPFLAGMWPMRAFARAFILCPFGVAGLMSQQDGQICGASGKSGRASMPHE